MTCLASPILPGVARNDTASASSRSWSRMRSASSSRSTWGEIARFGDNQPKPAHASRRRARLRTRSSRVMSSRKSHSWFQSTRPLRNPKTRARASSVVSRPDAVSRHRTRRPDCSRPSQPSPAVRCSARRVVASSTPNSPIACTSVCVQTQSSDSYMYSPQIVRRSDPALAPRRGRAWGTAGAGAAQALVRAMRSLRSPPAPRSARAGTRLR